MSAAVAVGSLAAQCAHPLPCYTAPCPFELTAMTGAAVLAFTAAATEAYSCDHCCLTEHPNTAGTEVQYPL